MVAYGHIGGERGAVFARRVAGLDPERVLLVGVDVAKATWFALGCTLSGEVVFEGCRLAADRAGLEELLGRIEGLRGRRGLQLVRVGVEAAGHQHVTLVGHLADVAGLEVVVLNPAAVAEERTKQLNRRRKSDAVDAAACCQLLRNGEGVLPVAAGPPVAALRTLWSGEIPPRRSRGLQGSHRVGRTWWRPGRGCVSRCMH